jgi:hypothetical protein
MPQARSRDRLATGDSSSPHPGPSWGTPNGADAANAIGSWLGLPDARPALSSIRAGCYTGEEHQQVVRRFPATTWPTASPVCRHATRIRRRSTPAIDCGSLRSRSRAGVCFADRIRCVQGSWHRELLPFRVAIQSRSGADRCRRRVHGMACMCSAGGRRGQCADGAHVVVGGCWAAFGHGVVESAGE